jgi:rsbT antagonist protein RsbS
MRVPILKQGKTLIATVLGPPTDADLVQLRSELVAAVRRHRSTGIVIDVTLLAVMDSFAARTLRGMTRMTRDLGAEAVIVGIRPEVAFAMVRSGLTLDGSATALDVADGLALLAPARRRGTADHGG